MLKSLLYTSFFICFHFFSLLSTQIPITPYLTSENDALSLVEGVVDAYNGKLVQIDQDITIDGSHPLQLTRYYDGGHHFDSNLGYGMGLNVPMLLAFDREGGKAPILLEQREGFMVPCQVTVKKHKEKRKKKYKKVYTYEGKVDPDFFKNGYTNCCESLLQGEASLVALQLKGTDDHFTVTLGDGTKRYYTYFHSDFHIDYYRLYKEDCPNGNSKYFSYYDSLFLKKIETKDKTNTLLLNSILFSYSKEGVAAKASNGQKVFYHLKTKKGKAKNTILFSSSTTHFSKQLLLKVTSDHNPSSEYGLLSRSHYTATLFSIKEILQPQGSFLKVDYDDQERVNKLWIAGLDKPLYTFKYGEANTKATDARGAVKRFEYHKRRLTKLTEPHQTHTYHWDKKGQLIQHTLTDPQGKTISQRSYCYDAEGHILEAKVTSKICRPDQDTSYVIHYHYADKRLVQEKHPDGLEFHYAYLPGTNLLTQKTTLFHQNVVEQENFQYDPHGILSLHVKNSGGISLFTEIDPSARCKPAWF